jgi:alpha-tubulin suppressor-like RCC1 family protein
VRARFVIALAVVVGACGDEPLTWYYRLGAGVDGVAVFEARIRAGGCDGEVVHEQLFAAGEAMTPPRLDAGEYGFEIEAVGDDCNVIGAGCTELTLPAGGATVIVDVVADPQASSCEAGTVCAAGRCVTADAGGPGIDGGVRDAGGDAGTRDAGGDAGECAGCWDGDTCVVGDSPSACGVGGGPCETCGCAGDACTAGVCVPTRPVTSVAAGGTHTCAIAGGALYCWGTGPAGQLGDWNTPRMLPAASDANTDWVELSTTTNTMCGRRGTALYCWGSNNNGQAGLGTGAGTTVGVVTEVVGARSWSQVSAGSFHTLGIDDAGQLYCWGQGENESCAVRDGANALEPMTLGSDVWDDTCAGLWQSCGIRAGSLYCWGWSTDGDTGTGVMGANLDVVTRVGSATDWSAIACGVGHTCALREDGRVFCFGCGDDSCYHMVEDACGGDCSGSLGTGVAASSSSPVEITGLRAVKIDANTHTCAIAMDERLQCWGTNADGQLGTGDLALRNVPTEVPGDRWIDVSTGRRHTCAIRDGGALYCWGRNEDYQLGTGAPQSPRLAPTRVCVN